MAKRSFKSHAVVPKITPTEQLTKFIVSLYISVGKEPRQKPPRSLQKRQLHDGEARKAKRATPAQLRHSSREGVRIVARADNFGAIGFL